MHKGVQTLMVLALIAAGAAVHYWPSGGSRPIVLPVPLAPAPQPAAAPPRPLSRVFLPVSIPIAAIRDQLNREVPLIFEGTEADPVHHQAIVDDHLTWRARRGPVDVNAAEGRLRLDVSAAGDALVRGKARPVRGSIGRILRRATRGASDIPFSARAEVFATLTATISPELLPDWRVRPNITSRIQVRRAEVPVAGITRISVRSRVRSALEKKVRRHIDRLEQRILSDDRLRRLAAREWERLHKVERLSEDPPTWLVVKPLHVEATETRVEAQDVHMGLGIHAETFVLIADTPPENPVSVLPPLAFTKESEGLLELNTPGIAPWKRLNRTLSDQLIHRSVQGSDGTLLQIRHASLAPWGDGVLLTIDLEAERGPMYRASGRLYLTAKPRLDIQHQRLHLDDLDFALETKDTLAAIATWMMEPTILEALQKRAVLDFSEYVQRATAKAERAIEKFIADMPQGIALTANLQRMAITGLRVTPDALQVTVHAEVQTKAALSRLTFPPPN